ncbi:hypothetical protein N0Y54_43455 [Nostoc punctiforme UO1]|uniref:hypothetical protein n=1 Tax=Nostoc punctiforme TaxID=272131 RepID=UPI0030965DA8
MPKRPKHNSDHAQRHHTPTIDNEAIAKHLEALLTPAVFLTFHGMWKRGLVRDELSRTNPLDLR